MRNPEDHSLRYCVRRSYKVVNTNVFLLVMNLRFQYGKHILHFKLAKEKCCTVLELLLMNYSTAYGQKIQHSQERIVPYE